MPVPSDNFTTNYRWQMPVVGGDIGAWGPKLNKIFGEDGSGGDTKGIDQVIFELQAEVDALELEVTDLETRIEVLEADPLSAYFARSIRSGALTVPKGVFTKVPWQATDFDENSMTGADITRMTIPTGGAGLYQIRVSLETDWTVGSGDDSRRWEVEIRRDRGGVVTVVGRAESPYQNDGVHDSDSGDITHLVSALDLAQEGDFYEVHVFQTFFAGGSSSGTVRASDGTYFEIARLAPEVT